jgi:hypothetical protein
MENLLLKSNSLADGQSLHIIRPLNEKIEWDERLIGILGARGTGKTTLLLQRMRQQYGVAGNAIYLSLDDIFFAQNSFLDAARYFIPEELMPFSWMKCINIPGGLQR